MEMNVKNCKSSIVENVSYPEEIGNKHLSCELVPCLVDVRAVSTLPVFLLRDQILETLKWLSTHRLHSMECVHNVGLHVGVLSSPAKALQSLVNKN